MRMKRPDVGRSIPKRSSKKTRLADWRRVDLALQRAGTYPHPAGSIVRIETHISVVYLAGRYAYKLCKPLDLGFADLSSVDARLRCCREALRLNRRLAPAIYLSVVAIRRVGGSVKIGDAGTPVEPVLKMRRFEERDTLSARLARAAVNPAEIDGIAERLACFHLSTSRHAPNPALGSAAQVREQLLAVLSSLESLTPSSVSGPLENWYWQEISRLGPHFDARRHDGFVRECHGDLHLENIVLRHGRATFFDCVEFSEALRWIDITADIAFLVMDLLAHERGELATRFLNRWLALTGDYDGLPALRLYVVYRALVRALAATLKGRSRPRNEASTAAVRENYLRLADRLTETPRVFLMLCHGFSGSGKSVASEALAQFAGAIRLSSDIERKRAARPASGATRASTCAVSPLFYTPEAVDANYERLRASTGLLLDAGYPVIVDATFLASTRRRAFLTLATERSIPALIVSFHAGAKVLIERLKARAMQAGEASDADEDVLRLQFAQAEPLTSDELRLTVEVDTDVVRDSFAEPAFWRDVLARLDDARG